MATHKVKIDTVPFLAIWNGSKKQEIRINDRDYKIGDYLDLRQTKWTAAEMKKGKPLEYAGCGSLVRITHIQEGYGLQKGYICLSLQH